MFNLVKTKKSYSAASTDLEAAVVQVAHEVETQTIQMVDKAK
jgi:hypothetical protein